MWVRGRLGGGITMDQVTCLFQFGFRQNVENGPGGVGRAGPGAHGHLQTVCLIDSPGQ
jgi:hypothetical protein